MASLSHVVLECLVPLLAQEVPAPTPPQQQPAPPWVVVDAPHNSWDDDLSDLQLVVLSDGTYVGSYHQWGHHFTNGRTHIVRSRDRGATWEKFAELSDLHDVRLIEHDDVVWLMGIEGAGPWEGPPVVLCLRDTAQTWVGGRSRLRAAQPLHAAEDTILHQGRVWRSFSRLRDENAADRRPRVCLASAALGSDLQDPASWRWSSELPLERADWMIFTVTPDDGLALAFTVGRTVDRLVDIVNEGSAWKPRADKPTWDLVAVGAWHSSLTRDPIGGSSYLLTGGSSRAPGRNMLSLVSSQDFREWSRMEWLHDVDASPVIFGPSALLVEGDDMAALISFEDPPSTAARGPNPLEIVFLRVPKFRERTADTPPLWGPPFPR